MSRTNVSHTHVRPSGIAVRCSRFLYVQILVLCVCVCVCVCVKEREREESNILYANEVMAHKNSHMCVGAKEFNHVRLAVACVWFDI